MHTSSVEDVVTGTGAAVARTSSRDATAAGARLVRPGLERHHIVFRSHDGPDVLSSLATMCAVHHRHAFHDRGVVHSKGDSPHGLEWRLPATTLRGGVRETRLIVDPQRSPSPS